MWSSMDGRLRPKRVRAWLALPAVAVLALVGIWFGLRRVGTVARSTEITRADDFRPLSAAGASRALRLRDGSKIDLDADGALEMTSDTADDLDLVFRGGRAHVVVMPAHRRWTIDVGVAAIQVSDAKFAMWRSASGVGVQVSEGVVVLRGEQVPGRVRRLSAGESLQFATTEQPQRAPAPPVAQPLVATTEVPVTQRSRVKASVPIARTQASTWRALAEEQKFAEAYEQLGEAGVRTASRSVDTIDELLKLSDVARLSGHPNDATAALERIAREFPADGRAGIAAFTLGRIRADDLNDWRNAANAFDHALTLGLPPALSEKAYYRLVEARIHSDERARASEAVERYRVAFPSGRLLKAAEALIAQ